MQDREGKVAKEIIRREKVRTKNAYEDFGEKAQNAEQPAGEAINHAFTLNEFARLFLLLRNNERARSGLSTAIDAELSKMQLHAHVIRESFWTVVEQRMSDEHVDTTEDFRV